MGKVEGSGIIGGLVGRNAGKINSSYSIVKVKGNKKVGGFVAQNQGGVVGTKNVIQRAMYGNIVGKNYWVGNRWRF